MTSGERTAETDAEPAKRKAAAVNLGNYSRLMEHFALIYGTATAWDGEARRIVPVEALRLAFTAEGVKAWLNTPTRRIVQPEDIVFEPGADLPPPKVNLFGGFEVQPREGDCRPILELLHHLVSASDATDEGVAAVMAWVLRWLALPLQRPGTKMHSALVFHGPEGSGKNLLFETIAKFYGEHAGIVGQDQLESPFNDWASRKLFLIGDEVVTRQELRHYKGKLKSLITSRDLLINVKMLPLRRESNHVNLVFLSNELQPLALDAGDRRYFVVYTPQPREPEFYDRIAKCVRSGGAEAFFAFLLKFDLGGYTAHSRPPLTSAKRDLIDLGLTPPERFASEWLGGVLTLPLRVCSSEQLFRAYVRWCSRSGVRWSGEAATFTRAMRKAAGDRLAYREFQVPSATGGRRHARGWIPTGAAAPEGTTEGQWIAAAIDAFAGVVDDFCDERRTTG